jgi:hypothetical protein
MSSLADMKLGGFYMRTLLLFLAIALSLSAPAKAEKKIDLKPHQLKDAQDPGSATHLIYETPKAAEKTAKGKSKITLGQTCTDQLGMIYKPGNTGYKGCMRTRDLTKPESSDQVKSVGITIGN